MPMDIAALIDHTMLHEMTHAISSGANRVAPTTDIGGPSAAYGGLPLFLCR